MVKVIKKCKKCQLNLSKDNFSVHNKDSEILRSICKTCFKQYQKEHRIKNIIRIKARDKIRSLGLKHRFGKLKWFSKNKNRILKLTLNEYIDLINQGCYYCNKSLNDESGYCLDRIDNKNIYSVETCLPCCGMCNYTKGNYYTVEETKIMINALLRYRNGESTVKI